MLHQQILNRGTVVGGTVIAFLVFWCDQSFLVNEKLACVGFTFGHLNTTKFTFPDLVKRCNFFIIFICDNLSDTFTFPRWRIDQSATLKNKSHCINVKVSCRLLQTVILQNHTVWLCQQTPSPRFYVWEKVPSLNIVWLMEFHEIAIWLPWYTMLYHVIPCYTIGIPIWHQCVFPFFSWTRHLVVVIGRLRTVSFSL